MEKEKLDTEEYVSSEIIFSDFESKDFVTISDGDDNDMEYNIWN